MYYRYTDEELRALCRTSLESFEVWARRVIHEKMVEEHGEAYIDKQFEDGNYLIKKDVRDHVHKMLEKEPNRFHRAVDTLFMEHIIYFLCNQEFYKKMFKDVLCNAYPQGREEAKEYMERLVPIRNALSHSGAISIRQAEKAICYSNDFIEGIKAYEKERGQEKVWNVPRIIRVTDSFGNVFENPRDTNIDGTIFVVSQDVYCGDTYSVYIEVDSSFAVEEYDINWEDGGKKIAGNKNCRQYVVTFCEKDVAESHFIKCSIISKKSWHKYGSHDCKVSLKLTIFPPRE